MPNKARPRTARNRTSHEPAYDRSSLAIDQKRRMSQIVDPTPLVDAKPPHWPCQAVRQKSRHVLLLRRGRPRPAGSSLSASQLDWSSGRRHANASRGPPPNRVKRRESKRQPTGRIAVHFQSHQCVRRSGRPSRKKPTCSDQPSNSQPELKSRRQMAASKKKTPVCNP